MACVQPIIARKSKWRGIEFEHESSSISGGRRIAVHEYPYREDHYSEDLGRSARRFNVTGYVTQPNLRDKIRRLRNSFEVPGPGPYYDAYANITRICRLETFSIDLARDDLTTASFSFTLVEKGAEPAPSAIRTAIAGLFSTIGRFNELLGSGFNLIYGTIGDGAAVFDGFTGAVGYFDFNLRRAGGTKRDDVLVSPAQGTPPVIQATNSANPVREAQFLGALAAIDAGSSVEGRVNALAFSGAAISRYAELTISKDYSGNANAFSEVQAFISASKKFQTIAESLGLYELSAASKELQALAGSRVTGQIRDIPKVMEYAGSGHPFVISKNLFGDISKAEDILNWNGLVGGDIIQGPVNYVKDNLA